MKTYFILFFSILSFVFGGAEVASAAAVSRVPESSINSGFEAKKAIKKAPQKIKKTQSFFNTFLGLGLGFFFLGLLLLILGLVLTIPVMWIMGVVVLSLTVLVVALIVIFFALIVGAYSC